MRKHYLLALVIACVTVVSSTSVRNIEFDHNDENTPNTKDIEELEMDQIKNKEIKSKYHVNNTDENIRDAGKRRKGNNTDFHNQVALKGHNKRNTHQSVERQKRSTDGKIDGNTDKSMGYCAKLNDKYKKYRKPEHFQFYLYGIPRKIVVMSTWRAPSRAMAAVIAVGLKYRVGYLGVELQQDNRTDRELAATVQPNSRTVAFTDTKTIIHVDVVREKGIGPALPGCTVVNLACSIAGPRLTGGRLTQSVNLRVYAFLAKEYVGNSECADTGKWFFYRNHTAVRNCGFPDSPDCVAIIIAPEVESSQILEVMDKVNTTGTLCKPSSITSRKELNLQLNNETKSFLLIDYDLGYENNSRVQIVKSNGILPQDVIAEQFADHFIFNFYAPNIAKIINATKLQPKHARELLDIYADTPDYEEAACKWAEENSITFESWTNLTNIGPIFLVILCENDPDMEIYEDVIKKLSLTLKSNIKEFDFSIQYLPINCTITTSIINFLLDYRTYSGWHTTAAGAAIPAIGAKETVDHADEIAMQLIFYDVPSSLNSLHVSTVSGSAQQLALAIKHFLKKQVWRRIVIISEDTPLSKDITIELLKGETIMQYRTITLSNVNTATMSSAVEAELLNLKENNAHVFFINAGYEVARVIACKASELNMVDDNEYAWIAREWRPTDCANDMQVFTVSYWWRGDDESLLQDTGGNASIRSHLNQIWNNGTWPALAEPIADACMAMVYRLQALIMKYPNRRYDWHSDNSTVHIAEELTGNKSVAGVIQTLRLENRMRYNPLVHVALWRRNISRHIAVWRVISDTNEIIEEKSVYEPYLGGQRPDDGRSRCLTTKSGDDFNPTCHDAIWICFALLIVVTPIALWKWRKYRIVEMKKRERQILVRLLSRCEKTAGVLAPHLVDRSALTIYEELGLGHFGRVRFGILRLRNSGPMPVAAKTLRKDAAPAEEAEFLREASTMAVLSHAHVIRLVGVCADVEGPPFLLMEHAFFGDLLKYLRQRRHLAEVNERDPYIDESPNRNGGDGTKCVDQEAYHVSPKELTRLAREAADALAYLSDQYILHRDMRAANCLVDERRALKLADFGMARSVGSNNRIPEDTEEEESEDYKYICRRRGVFPVPWMAPESLEKGIFSRASDVWALGVLILEIATLGARPYGPWQPMQVLRFVRSGGRPPLPRDASYHTCEITEMCWCNVAEERKSAKAVLEYLQLHPTAIRAALRPAWPEPNIGPDGSDSGFGERDGDREWSRGADLRVSTL